MPRYLNGGDTALTIEFGDTVDCRLSARVLTLFVRLSAAPPPGAVEFVPTLRSLTAYYDPNLTSAEQLAHAIDPLLHDLEETAVQGLRWVLPVCYEPSLAPDIAEVATSKGLSQAEVVRLHAGSVYRVYMLGFLPGQAYIGDLAPELRLPRRATPRTAVSPGSVAIATGMTTIYSLESPGGWHLIGRTPAPLFDPARSPAVLLSPGDEVRFEAVTLTEFDDLEAASRDGRWQPQPETGGQ